MLKRWLKLLGKILLALIVLLVVFLLVGRFRGQIALASYRRKLAAQGEKLSPQHFVSAVCGVPVITSGPRRLPQRKLRNTGTMSDAIDRLT